MPIPPVNVPVNLTGQWILTVAVIVALLGVGVSALRMSRRQQSWGPIAMLVGSLLAGFIEPMYCLTMHLWYYQPGQWTMVTALGNKVPIWAWISYSPFYGGLTLWVWHKVDQGATRAALAKLAGVLVLIGIATEIACITLGTYEYYGPHPFRLLSFPIWIAVANAVIGIVAGIVAARLRPLLPGTQALAYVALVPATMAMIQFGTGFLALDAINTPHPSSWLLYVCATVSMVLAATVAFVALKLVPSGVVALDVDKEISPQAVRQAVGPTG